MDTTVSKFEELMATIRAEADRNPAMTFGDHTSAMAKISFARKLMRTVDPDYVAPFAHVTYVSPFGRR